MKEKKNQQNKSYEWELKQPGKIVWGDEKDGKDEKNNIIMNGKIVSTTTMESGATMNSSLSHSSFLLLTSFFYNVTVALSIVEKTNFIVLFCSLQIRTHFRQIFPNKITTPTIKKIFLFLIIKNWFAIEEEKEEHFGYAIK